jgi:hypothetical protein
MTKKSWIETYKEENGVSSTAVKNLPSKSFSIRYNFTVPYPEDAFVPISSPSVIEAYKAEHGVTGEEIEEGSEKSFQNH